MNTVAQWHIVFSPKDLKAEVFDDHMESVGEITGTKGLKNDTRSQHHFTNLMRNQISMLIRDAFGDGHTYEIFPSTDHADKEDYYEMPISIYKVPDARAKNVKKEVDNNHILKGIKQRFSKRKPTIEGYYWYAHDFDDPLQILHVKKFDTEAGEHLRATDMISNYEDMYYWTGYWQGSPIPEPQIDLKTKVETVDHEEW